MPRASAEGRLIVQRPCAVFGVAYPAVAPYLGDFFRSLASQDFREFDLVLLNDSFEGLGALARAQGFEIKELAPAGSPAENRAEGINRLVSMGYKHVVFADLDDYFEPGRVRVALSLLERCDLAVNELSLVDSAGKLLKERYLSGRLTEGQEIGPDFVREFNILGFSNTAARLSSFDVPLSLPPELLAVDWYLFARALQAGAKALFTSGTLTYYRQHGGNTIGMGEGLEQRLEAALRAKLLHYKHMKEVDPSYAGLYRSIDALSLKMIELSYRRQYLERVRRLALRNPLWWEEIRTPEELGL